MRPFHSPGSEECTFLKGKAFEGVSRQEMCEKGVKEVLRALRFPWNSTRGEARGGGPQEARSLLQARPQCLCARSLWGGGVGIGYMVIACGHLTLLGRYLTTVRGRACPMRGVVMVSGYSASNARRCLGACSTHPRLRVVHARGGVKNTKNFSLKAGVSIVSNKSCA